MVCFVPVKTEALLDILGTSFGVRVVRKDDGRIELDRDSG